MSKIDTPIIDFHMHPGPPWLPTERRLHKAVNIKEHLEQLRLDMDRAGIDRAVIMLLDEDWFLEDAGNRLIALCKKELWNERFIFCGMFDIFRPYEADDVLRNVENAAGMGVRGIKIHPVLQRITKADFPNLLLLVRKAEELGMFVVVHAYSETIEEFDNMGLEIVAYIAAKAKVPIVIAHAGGIDFSRAVILAQRFSNIMIDLSYFYQLENMLNLNMILRWGISILGIERFLFGSDHPSCQAAQYKERILESLREVGLNEPEIAMIMGKNALRVLGVTK